MSESSRGLGNFNAYVACVTCGRETPLDDVTWDESATGVDPVCPQCWGVSPKAESVPPKGDLR